MEDQAEVSSGPRSREPRKFPYYPLEFAVKLSERLFEEGGGRVDRQGMAELLELKPRSSALEMRIISAAMFGLVTRKEGTIVLTPLGRLAAKPSSPEERAAALAQAFDSVPLFSTIRRTFAGQPLPGEAGLKVRLIRDWGVPAVQKAEAYNVLMRSANFAGILIQKQSGQYLTSLSGRAGRAAENGDNGEMSDVDSYSNVERTDVVQESETSRAVREGLHPSIKGLVDEMARDARQWDAEQRRIWEAALKSVMDYVYPQTRRDAGTGG
jgi:hypothetical protein